MPGKNYRDNRPKIRSSGMKGFEKRDKKGGFGGSGGNSYKENREHAERQRREARERRNNSGGSGKKGGFCFLTTACVEHAGLPDNCRELTLMRRLRDDYVAHLPDGRHLIEDYYATAPDVVTAIKSQPDAADRLTAAFAEIRAVCQEVESGRMGEALAMFQRFYSAEIERSR